MSSSPIGIGSDRTLVFGERRLRACRDILGWTKIDCRVVNVTSLVEGEQTENDLRKDFTPSERVAIGQAVADELSRRRGGDRGNQFTGGKPDDGPACQGDTRDIVAERVGFGSGKQYERASNVVALGTPKLVEAMDRGEVSISAAASFSSGSSSGSRSKGKCARLGTFSSGRPLRSLPARKA